MLSFVKISTAAQLHSKIEFLLSQPPGDVLNLHESGQSDYRTDLYFCTYTFIWEKKASP